MKTNIILFLLFLCIHVSACNGAKNSSNSGEQPKSTITNIDVSKAKSLIGEKKDIIILDVRTPGEVSQGIIPNAVVIDINSNNFEQEVAKLDKSKPILVYCKAGGRSARACGIMEKAGFKELYNLTSGYDGWK